MVAVVSVVAICREEGPLYGTLEVMKGLLQYGDYIRHFIRVIEGNKIKG